MRLPTTKPPCYLAVRVLRGAGYQVRSSENAEEALQMVNGQHFDLSLTVVVMPGMDVSSAESAISWPNLSPRPS